MKKMIPIFVILVVALGSVVSASALPMPDLTGCPNIEYDNGNLIFNNVVFSSLDKTELQPILDCFASESTNNSGFIAFSGDCDYNNPKSVLFEFYAFSSGGPPQHPFCGLILRDVLGRLYISSYGYGVFPHYKWSFFADGTVRYDGYKIAQNVIVDNLLIAETSIFNQVSSIFKDSDKFFIDADFKKFVIKDDLNINLSFYPIVEGSLRPPEVEKPIDYIPYDKDIYTGFIDCFFESVLVIVPIGISLFLIILLVKLFPKVLRSFVW